MSAESQHPNPAAPKSPEPKLWGLAAEFTSPEEILAAAREIAARGYVRAEAYTPFAVEELAETLGYRRSRVPRVVLISGVCGGIGGFFMQWFANVIHLPWNVGGKPPNSWPAFVPITFEMTILFAAFGAVFGMFAMNRLPQLYHPVFNIPNFDRSTLDRFFLCIESSDPQFDRRTTLQLLESTQPIAVTEVPE